jgi:Na+-transporting methylmalonyl-CoA/oxaloacetate decarboxylase gamma subunit
MGWIIATVVLFLMLIAVTWFFGHVIMRMYAHQSAFEDELEDRIDDALRILDASFMEIAVVANKPVMFDSPEVRAVVAAVQHSRDAVVFVGKLLNNVVLDDVTENVTPKNIEYVTKDDPHAPKSAAELDVDVRRDLLAAARRGEVEIITPEPARRGPQDSLVRPSSTAVAVRRATRGREA